MDEYEYLQPGFDPASYTMPKLRNALMTHDIEYPSNAKKAQLIELFETHITPQAHTILKKAGRVKASNKGIVDVADFGTIGEPITEATPRKKRSTRRKTQVGTLSDEDDRTTADEDALEPVFSKSVKKATSRRKTASPVKRIIDDEPSVPDPIYEVETPKPRPGRKSTRKSMSVASTRSPEPQPELEPEPERVEEEVLIKDEEPAFSSFNPFQQGSSPSVQDRRKSMPAKDTENRRKSGSSRRKTDFVPSKRSASPFVDTTNVEEEQEDEKAEADTSNTSFASRFFPLAKMSTTAQKQAHQARDELNKHNDEIAKKINREPSVQPGEEFTPDEQLEVEEADAEAHAHGSFARDRVVRSSSNKAPASLIWVILGMVLTAYFAWWRKEKLEIGYCGVGRRVDFGDSTDWASVVRPKCEPCPLHATCFPELKTVCDQDYVLVPHSMSLGGLVPLAPTCRPDSEKLRRIAVLANEALKNLRVRAAQVECGEVNLDEEGEEGLSENELRNAIYQRKAPGLSDAAFNDLWRHSLSDLQEKEEVVTTIDGRGEKFFKSTSLANLSLSCTIRKSVKGTLAKHKIEIFGVFLMIIAFFRLKNSLASSREYQAQVSGLVQKALRALAQQQQMHYADPTKAAVSYVPVGQLRDRILRHEYNPEKRRHLWEGVSKIVETNSNVRATHMEVHGEVMRCWTWIGSSTLLDDSQPDENEVAFIQGGADGRGFTRGRRVGGGDTPGRILY